MYARMRGSVLSAKYSVSEEKGNEDGEYKVNDDDDCVCMRE